MNEMIKNMVSYVLDKKYPGWVEEIGVTTERDLGSYYIDDKRNYIINVFIGMAEEHQESNKLGIVHLVEDTIKSMGIPNRVLFFWN